MIPWKINNRKRSYIKENEVESRTEQTQLFPCKEKEMATIELTDGGRPQVGAQEVRHAHSSRVTRRGDKEGKGDTRQRTPSPKPQRQPSPNPRDQQSHRDEPCKKRRSTQGRRGASNGQTHGHLIHHRRGDPSKLH